MPVAGLGCWDFSGNGSSSSTGSTASAPATDPPVIQEIDTSQTVTENGAYYDIYFSVTYSDDDDVVVSAAVYVPVIGKTIQIPIPASLQQSSGAGIPLGFQVSDDIPLGGAGETNFQVTLTNSAGVVSTAYTMTIDLE